MTAHKQLLEALATYSPTEIPCRASSRPQDWISESSADQTRAAEACLSCPVLGQCATYAISAEEPAGVWGGHTYPERRKIELANRRNPEPGAANKITEEETQ